MSFDCAGTIHEPPGRPAQHRCQPPARRPRHQWRTVPPNAMHAKPVVVPTTYPAGTLWRCPCGEGWRNVTTPPRRYGYSPRGTHWEPLRWWQWRLRRALRSEGMR